jgi:hypothetical protein
MNKRENEKKERLDELISRTVNTEEPQFNAEKWKQKYRDEYQSLLSRASEEASTDRLNIRRMIFRNPITKVAAAAVIIIAVSFFTARQVPTEQADTITVSKVTKSPVEMMTAISLERAFRRGGIEAVEKQCEQAFKPIGPWPRSLSVEQILAEFNDNGKSSERTRL